MPTETLGLCPVTSMWYTNIQCQNEIHFYSPSCQLRRWVSVPSQVCDTLTYSVRMKYISTHHNANWDIGFLSHHRYVIHWPTVSEWNTFLFTVMPAETLGLCSITGMWYTNLQCQNEIHFYSPSCQLRHWVSAPSQVCGTLTYSVRMKYISTHRHANWDIGSLFRHRYVIHLPTVSKWNTFLLTIMPTETLGLCSHTGMWYTNIQCQNEIHFYSLSGQLRHRVSVPSQVCDTLTYSVRMKYISTHRHANWGIGSLFRHRYVIH